MDLVVGADLLGNKAYIVMERMNKSEIQYGWEK